MEINKDKEMRLKRLENLLNVVCESSNLSIDTINPTIETQNLSIETSNPTIETSNLFIT